VRVVYGCPRFGEEEGYNHVKSTPMSRIALAGLAPGEGVSPLRLYCIVYLLCIALCIDSLFACLTNNINAGSLIHHMF
jgi:hypothetical protein